jgi:hypothetical protein
VALILVFQKKFFHKEIEITSESNRKIIEKEDINPEGDHKINLET